MEKKTGKQFFCLIILFLININALMADTLSVRLNPNRPLKGETFSLDFIVDLTSNNEPFISFDPGGLEVLGKREGGISIQTMIVNGNLSTKKTMTVSYDLLSSRAGNFYIKDITAEVGDKTLKHKNITVRVLNSRPRPKDMFLKAEVNKQTVFVGEGIDLRYYLYYRVPKVNQEIKSFPKLNKFIKRFHHKNNEREETVEYQGVVYRRTLMYSARLYPEAEGKAFIDPLRIQVQFQKRTRNSPFGSFGFNIGRLQSKVLQSDRVKITVKPIPTENLPNDFTGLVGKHEFSLTMPRSKFLVNEAVELRLMANGPGALEKMEAPKLLQNDAFEEFDTKSDLTETSKSQAQKVFDYTFLARGPVDIKDLSYSLSYFDPETENFESIELKIPELVVQGTQGTPVRGGNTSQGKSSQERSDYRQDVFQDAPLKPLSPIFTSDSSSTLSLKLLGFTNIGLGVIIILSLIWLLVPVFLGGVGPGVEDKIFKDIVKNGITYSKVFQLFQVLSKDISNEKLVGLVNDLPLSEGAKTYFKGIIQDLERSTFSNVDKKRVRINKGYFKELLKVIKSESIKIS